MAMNSETLVAPRSLALPMSDERHVAPRAKAERARIARVEPASAADEAGLQTGDVVTHVNSEPVLDIVDWAFLTAGERLALTVQRAEVGPVTVTIAKGYDEDIGVEFSEDLFDRVHICKNKCVFCFLYQQPKGLRPSLYIKDDDYRLSFLHGNYLTLTNISDEEFARIRAQRLSPLFVSVHATDPDVRGIMLGRKTPEPILPRLRLLADAGIQTHCQIVLCPGYNDGPVLQQTIRELASLHPSDTRRGGVLTVAVVPVGLTQFRDRLASLRACDPVFCAALVKETAAWQGEYRRELGTSFVFLSDEFYLAAGAPVPSAARYEGFPQLEDGVGLVRQFLDDLARLSRRLPERVLEPRRATLVTGELAAPLLWQLAETLNRVENVAVNVCAVPNSFFQGNISVAGLLTGGNILRALQAMNERLGDTVVLPSIMLRDPERDVFLDDMTLLDLQSALGRPVLVVERTPTAAASALLDTPDSPERKNTHALRHQTGH